MEDRRWEGERARGGEWSEWRRGEDCVLKDSRNHIRKSSKDSSNTKVIGAILTSCGSLLDRGDCYTDDGIFAEKFASSLEI